MKIIFLLFIFSLFACAEKGTPSKTKLQIRARDLLASSKGLEQSGGVVVVGRAVAKEAIMAFSLTNANETLTVELPNDAWEFSAVGWEGGSGLMSGAVRCSGVIAKTLIGSPESVELVINKTNCGKTVYTPDGLYNSTSSSVLPLKLQSCKEIDSSGTCTAQGKYLSFRIGHPITYGVGADFFYQYELDAWDESIDHEASGPSWPTDYVQLPRTFSSACINTDTSGVATTNYYIPPGGFDSDGAIFPFIIGYEQANCLATDTTEEYEAYFFDEQQKDDEYSDGSYRLLTKADSGYMLTMISDDNYDGSVSKPAAAADYAGITEEHAIYYMQNFTGEIFDFASVAVDDIYIYRTQNNKYGKLQITATTGAQLNFSFETFGSATSTLDGFASGSTPNLENLLDTSEVSLGTLYMISEPFFFSHQGMVKFDLAEQDSTSPYKYALVYAGSTTSPEHVFPSQSDGLSYDFDQCITMKVAALAMDGKLAVLSSQFDLNLAMTTANGSFVDCILGATCGTPTSSTASLSLSIVSGSTYSSQFSCIVAKDLSYSDTLFATLTHTNGSPAMKTQYKKMDIDEYLSWGSSNLDQAKMTTTSVGTLPSTSEETVVIGFKRSDGRYGKMQIINFSGTFSVNFVVYESDGTIFMERTGLSFTASGDSYIDFDLGDSAIDTTNDGTNEDFIFSAGSSFQILNDVTGYLLL